MKRTLAVIIIIIAVISLTITSSLVIRKYYRILKEEIENIEMLYKNDEISDKDLTFLEENWDNAKTIFLIFANHDSIEEIELNIKRLCSAAKTKNSSSFYAEAEELKCRLYFLKENESFSATSIF